MIAVVHLAVTVRVDPPAAPAITSVAKSVLGLEAGRAVHFELLERSARWQRISRHYGIVESSLACHVDDRTISTTSKGLCIVRSSLESDDERLGAAFSAPRPPQQVGEGGRWAENAVV